MYACVNVWDETISKGEDKTKYHSNKTGVLLSLISQKTATSKLLPTEKQLKS